MIDFLDALPDCIVGFEPWEIKEVTTDYVCSICYGELVALDMPNERIYIIVCPEHGNVEQIGRVRREFVDNEMARQHSQFKFVIRNLAEFWGELIEPIQHTPLRDGETPEQRNIRELGF